MIAILVAVLALLPLAAFAIGLKLTKRVLPAVLLAGVVGACMGAFFASAGSAMASAVQPRTALLRGGGIGLAGGVAVGSIAALVATLWRRRSTT